MFEHSNSNGNGAAATNDNAAQSSTGTGTNSIVAATHDVVKRRRNKLRRVRRAAWLRRGWLIFSRVCDGRTYYYKAHCLDDRVDINEQAREFGVEDTDERRQRQDRDYLLSVIEHGNDGAALGALIELREAHHYNGNGGVR